MRGVWLIGMIGVMMGGTSIGAQQPSETATSRDHVIPMDSDKRWSTVTVRIPGVAEPLRFIVDTGAGGHVIDRVTAERLGLRASVLPDVTTVGATGLATESQHVVVPEMTIGSLTLKNAGLMMFDLSAFARDGIRYDGILGNSLLEGFSMVFDAPARAIHLIDAPAVPAATGQQCLANRAGPDRIEPLRHFGLIAVNASTDVSPARSTEATAIVDSGSVSTSMNWRAAAALGVTPETPGVTPLAPSVGLNTALKTKGHRYVLPILKIGTRTIRDLKVRIDDYPVFKATQLDDRPAMILGMDVLGSQAVGIDRGAGRICFNAPVAAA